MSAGETCPSCSVPLAGARRCGSCGAAALAGDFVIERVIAQTPHGRTYVAHGPDGQRVALKELVFALVPTVQQLEAFEREATLLRGLEHGQIPRFVSSFREGEGPAARLYLAQELVEGPSLKDRLEDHRFDEQEILNLAQQVLPVLAWLHARGIIHRDVKPANLMQGRDGKVKLVDFGAARELLSDVTHGATLVGTFGYMPPEQLGGTVDASADVYALGATLVHLLGRKPPAELIRADLSLDLRGLPCSPRTRSILAQMLDRREKRPRTGSEAMMLLSMGPKASRGVRYAIVASLSLAVGLFAVVVGGIVTLARSQEEALKARSAAVANDHVQNVLDKEWEAEMGAAIPRAGQGKVADVKPTSAREPSGVLLAQGGVVAMNAVVPGDLLVRSDPPAPPCWSRGSFELVSLELPGKGEWRGSVYVSSRTHPPPDCPYPYPVAVHAYDIADSQLPVISSNTAQDGRLVQQFGAPMGPAPIRLSVDAGKDPIETWEVLPRERSVHLAAFAIPGSLTVEDASFEDAQGPGCLRWSNLSLGGGWVERPAQGPDKVRFRAVFRKLERKINQDQDCAPSPFKTGGLAVRKTGGGAIVPARLVTTSKNFANGILEQIYEIPAAAESLDLLIGDPDHPLATAELDLGARTLARR